jgi:hypothetical protein
MKRRYAARLLSFVPRSYAPPAGPHSGNMAWVSDTLATSS